MNKKKQGEGWLKNTPRVTGDLGGEAGGAPVVVCTYSGAMEAGDGVRGVNCPTSCTD